jgi:hypothetical protein
MGSVHVEDTIRTVGFILVAAPIRGWSCPLCHTVVRVQGDGAGSKAGPGWCRACLCFAYGGPYLFLLQLVGNDCHFFLLGIAGADMGVWVATAQQSVLELLLGTTSMLQVDFLVGWVPAVRAAPLRVYLNLSTCNPVPR